MTFVQDTVNQSMTSAVPLLYPIATQNNDPALQTVFCDPENGAVIAGFRREVASFGVCLTCAQYGRDNEIKVGNNLYGEKNPGLINYNRQSEYVETHEGLLGSEVRDGHREAINYKSTMQKIEDVRSQVENEHEVILNPGAIFNFMYNTMKTHKETVRDRKVNMQFTTSTIPPGHLIATAENLPTGEKVIMTYLPVNGMSVLFHFHVHESSKIHVTKLEPNVYYLVKPLRPDAKTGKRYADVLRPHYEGLRLAMQSFKMGIIKPSDPAYDVNADKTNGLLARNIKDFSYSKDQSKRKIQGAPMMTLDLDMFYSLMNTLSGYSKVIMQFKNSTTGVYFRAKGHEYLPDIEAIMGATIQHVRGRIWLP